MSRTTQIARVRGRRMWDSRGRPTVEAEVELRGGASGRAIAPAGASRGSGEAVDRRDGGAAFGGYDVRAALAAVNDQIGPALQGLDAAERDAVERRLIELDIDRQGAQITVLDIPNGETDLLTAIEFVQFEDATLDTSLIA